jgi:hypothetical protein
MYGASIHAWSQKYANAKYDDSQELRRQTVVMIITPMVTVKARGVIHIS